ncbi:MAG: hypothetical protein COW63_14020 [Bacteroidetes bacterium CG18_big_fil_WC_8_21_14_2_50_41_14]|nr:MAG: hypothetical protein COW63_14020 [Bacteroidetes bacterium CG18_big_fil_WC_8_21_14_2_50_41_14]PJB59910.1 MAG: hypothetical protein CO098_00880 [Bacteroidetes bacterium CG_4_9_14_3_um_filter_41_19]
MKKKIFLTLLIVIAFVLFGRLVFDYYVNKNKIQLINKDITSSKYLNVFDNYFYENGSYPINLSDIWSNADSSDQYYLKSIFSDPFSLKGTDTYMYCPHFDKSHSYIKGFVLISRGPDKAFNTKCGTLLSKGKDISKNDNLYNGFEVSKDEYNPFARIETWPWLLVGSYQKKDLLILYWDLLKFRERQSAFYFDKKNYNIDSTYKRIMKYGYSNKKYLSDEKRTNQMDVAIPLDSVQYAIKQDSITFHFNNYLFICKLCTINDIDNIHLKSIYGVLDRIDKKNKVIKLKYCTTIPYAN